MSKCRWQSSWHHHGVTVIDCVTCGFKHQYPLPGKDEVASLYRNEYYENVKPDYLKTVMQDRDHIHMWARNKKSICEKLLSVPKNRKPRILDIGSSFGQFLSVFAEAGWQAIGIEPSVYAAGIAKENSNLEIHNDLFENIPDGELSPPFDIVHLSEVINHLREPAAILQRIYDGLLAKGGLVVVETANDFNPLQWAVVETHKDVPWWIVPDHIVYFDVTSLQGLLEKVGFVVKEVGSTFPMEIFPLMGDNYRQSTAMGRDCHRKRIELEMNLAEAGRITALQDLYRALGSAGFGRSIIVYAQR